MATAKITKRAVDGARPSVRVRDGEGHPCAGYLFDTEVKGFGLKITPKGHRVYFVHYRPGGGRRAVKRWHTIGPHGSPWTPESARTEAKRILGEVAAGQDPAASRSTNRKAMTVTELCEKYLAAVTKGLVNGKRGKPKKASTIYTDKGRIERHVKPLLGNRKVIDLSVADCSKFMRDVASGKTSADVKTKKRGRAIVKGGRGTATRTVGLLGGILTFAISEGIRSDNPTHAVERYAYKKRKVVLSSDQYAALGTALDEAERAGENPKAIAAVRLIAVTGCRSGEIERLRQAETDRAGHCFRLSDSKEGESIRPIGKPAFDVIEGLIAEGDNPFLLPADRGRGHFKGLPKAWKRIQARSSALRGLTLHGLRHAFASVANELGYTEATRAALLGHTSSGSQTGDYTHHLDAVLVAAAERVAGRIHGMMTGRLAEVIQLPAQVA